MYTLYTHIRTLCTTFAVQGRKLAGWLTDRHLACRGSERERNEMCKEEEEEEEEDSRLVIPLLLMLAVVKQYAPLVFALCSPTLVFAVSVFLLTMLAASFCIYSGIWCGENFGDGCRICARALSGLSSGSDLRDFLFCSPPFFFFTITQQFLFEWVCRISSGLVWSKKNEMMLLHAFFNLNLQFFCTAVVVGVVLLVWLEMPIRSYR